MIYINDSEVKQLHHNWFENIDVIEETVKCLASNEYSQPIKPYLRYGDLKNRVIAMPAFVGGNINRAGIKWISSFPDNIKRGIPRAHCVVILNDKDTGEPVCILNSATISSIRTASVSGFVIRKYLENRSQSDITVGIVGFGPIGQYHMHMCSSILNNRCSRIILNDLKGIDVAAIHESIRNKVEVVDSWEKVYDESDIFITCTVSKERYIDRQPKARSLHLNISLRDYKPSVYQWFKDAMIVDDWEEICRENTDIERFHLEKGLKKDDVRIIQDLLNPDWIKSIKNDEVIMFNPMGMAVFDIAISQYYMMRMKNENKCQMLD